MSASVSPDIILDIEVEACIVELCGQHRSDGGMFLGLRSGDTVIAISKELCAQLIPLIEELTAEDFDQYKQSD